MDHAHDLVPSLARERPLKRAVNLSLPAGVVAEAKTLGLNLSEIAEVALRRAIVEARVERWRTANADAIDSWNAWVCENGEPFEDLRPW